MRVNRDEPDDIRMPVIINGAIIASDANAATTSVYSMERVIIE